MKIAITGADGRMGVRLVEILGKQHEIIAWETPDLDITDFQAVTQAVENTKPDLVINPAALTDVDGCARNPQEAIRVNGYGAQNIAVATQRIGSAIMQISSNEVFNGKNNRPYYEYDQREAVNPYGYSKLYGEIGVERTNPHHYIVRTAWLFTHGGRNFIQAILGAAQAGKDLSVVTDEVANPTYTYDVVDAIAQLIKTERYGAYHLVNEGIASRFQFACYALDKAGMMDTPIKPISINEWSRPSRPPLYAGMENLAGKALGITLRPWQEAVDAFLQAEDLLG